MSERSEAKPKYTEYSKDFQRAILRALFLKQDSDLVASGCKQAVLRLFDNEQPRISTDKSILRLRRTGIDQPDNSGDEVLIAGCELADENGTLVKEIGVVAIRHARGSRIVPLAGLSDAVARRLFDTYDETCAYHNSNLLPDLDLNRLEIVA